MRIQSGGLAPDGVSVLGGSGSAGGWGGRPENMVHHTMNTSSKPAPKASSKISNIQRAGAVWFMAAIVGSLLSCSSPPRQMAPLPERPNAMDSGSAPAAATAASAAPAATQGVPRAGLAGLPGTPAPDRPIKSRWTAVPWDALPGWGEDSMHEAWNAWLKNCERPGPLFGPLCADVRRLSIADAEEQRLWMITRLQPYRVEPVQGSSDGLLTSYYEPLLTATRQSAPGFGVPLYALPVAAQQAQRQGRAWYTRQQIDSLPEARAALTGLEIAWLADPIDALVLHIQGSGQLRLLEPDGRTRLVRMAFAGSNEQPYQSVGRWLLDQGLVRDASWAGIKDWVARNPQRAQEMLWANPRYVFFREEALSEDAADAGPRGAQGVPLTAGRSIAVDRESIPYATPVWLASSGPALRVQRLVFAQDTGSAIVGAVRADYYAGSGAAAGELAARVKQNLRLWVLWPR